MQPDGVDPLISQTMNYVWSNSLRLKYQRFTPSGCKLLGFEKRICNHCTTPLERGMNVIVGVYLYYLVGI